MYTALYAVHLVYFSCHAHAASAPASTCGHATQLPMHTGTLYPHPPPHWVLCLATASPAPCRGKGGGHTAGGGTSAGGRAGRQGCTAQAWATHWVGRCAIWCCLLALPVEASSALCCAHPPLQPPNADTHAPPLLPFGLGQGAAQLERWGELGQDTCVSHEMVCSLRSRTCCVALSVQRFWLISVCPPLPPFGLLADGFQQTSPCAFYLIGVSC